MPASAVGGDRREMVIPGLDAAAKKIQCLFRAKRARYVLRCESPTVPAQPVTCVRKMFKKSTT